MKTLKYKHIFFDLDHTLWDFNASAAHTFEMMYEYFQLVKMGVHSLDDFVSFYHIHNDAAWALYREGKMEKEILRNIRFELALKDFGIEDAVLAEKLADFYLYHAPRNVFLFPEAIETLSCLSKKYQLHIITNGFQEVQYIKLETSGMDVYFKEIITSEEAGVKKPDPGIFHYALKRAGAIASESLMVGDDAEVDVAGALAVGMDAVFFNPEMVLTHLKIDKQIANLSELCILLA